mgnify:CR=1 FL=1
MRREVFVYDHEQGRCVPKAERVVKGQVHIIGDDLGEWIIGHADGKRYRSKSALHQSYRDHGKVVVGNDIRDTVPQRDLKPLNVRDLWDRAERKHKYKNDD